MLDSSGKSGKTNIIKKKANSVETELAFYIWRLVGRGLEFGLLDFIRRLSR